MAQVSTKTVRYYDRRGLLNPARIERFTGYRYYTLGQLSRLNRIVMLKDLGFTLNQRGHILEEPRPWDELRGMFVCIIPVCKVAFLPFSDLIPKIHLDKYLSR